MYIFAGSPDSLAQQKNFYDSTNIRLAEADRALRQQAADDERKNYLFQQQQADQRERANQEDAMRFSLALMGNQEAQRNEARRQYEFGVGLADRKAQDEESKRRFGIETGLKERELSARSAQQGAEIARKTFGDLADAIQNGEITDEKQIDTLFSNLDPTLKARGKAFLGARLKGLATDWDTINNMAGAATALVSPMPTAPKPESHLFGLYHTQPPTSERTKLSEDEAMAKLIQSNNKNMLQYQPTLQWDENLQRFLPLIKKPQFDFGATNAPAPSPALTPTAPVATPAGALNAANLMPWSVAPPTPPRPLPLLTTNLPPAPAINWSAPPTNAIAPAKPVAAVTAPALTGGVRMRVLSPPGKDGKRQYGTIPASQVAAALRNGYTLAE